MTKQRNLTSSVNIAKHTTKIADGVVYKKKRKIIGTDVNISYGIINIKVVE